MKRIITLILFFIICTSNVYGLTFGKTPASAVGKGTVNDTEYDYLNGVTDYIQSQLNNKIRVFSRVTDPDVNFDSGDGVSENDLCYNTVSQSLFICVNNTLGAAQWATCSSSGGDDWDSNNDNFIDDEFISSDITRDTELANYATVSSLADYATVVSLSGYVTNSSLTTTLGSYTTSSALAAILSDYVLETTLNNYALSSSIPDLSTPTIAGNFTELNSTGPITSTNGVDGTMGLWWGSNNTIDPTVTQPNGIFPGPDGIYVRWNNINSLIGSAAASSVSVDGTTVNNPNFDSTGDIDVVATGSNVAGNIKSNVIDIDNFTAGTLVDDTENVDSNDNNTSIMTTAAVKKYMDVVVDNLVNTRLSDAGFTILNCLNPSELTDSVDVAAYTISGNIYDGGTEPTVEVALNNGSFIASTMTGTSSPWVWSSDLTLIEGANTIDVRGTNSDADIVIIPQITVTYTPSIIPTVTSITANGTEVAMLCSTPMQVGAGGSGGFVVSVDSTPVSTTFINITDQTVNFTVPEITVGQTITATYTQPTNGFEAITGGGDLGGFTDTEVINATTGPVAAHSFPLDVAGVDINAGKIYDSATDTWVGTINGTPTFTVGEGISSASLTDNVTLDLETYLGAEIVTVEYDFKFSVVSANNRTIYCTGVGDGVNFAPVYSAGLGRLTVTSNYTGYVIPTSPYPNVDTWTHVRYILDLSNPVATERIKLWYNHVAVDTSGVDLSGLGDWGVLSGTVKIPGFMNSADSSQSVRNLNIYYEAVPE